MQANGLQLARRSLDHTRDHASLLRKLWRYRDAWLDLDIQSCFKQDCGDEDMTLWGLRDGVFAKAYPQNASAVSGPKAAMAFFPLDEAGENRTQINLDVTFNEFTTDLGQDLVVLAGVDPDRKSRGWLRLRSSTTGRAHPQAEHPLSTIELGFSVDTGISSTPVTLGIKNELVAAMFASPGQRVYEILIWNWKTGELLHRISCNTGICSFGFLDDDRLVVWSASSSNVENGLAVVSLLVYEQIGSGTGLGRDASHCEPLNVTSFPILKPSFTFQFPKLQTPSFVGPRGFLLQSDYGSGSGISASAPFVNLRALTLGLTMNISLYRRSSHFRIFIDTHRLLKHRERAREKAVSKLSWDEWGEHSTRWFFEERSGHQTCLMFGSRALFTDEHLSIVDFHTPTVHRSSNCCKNTYVSLERSMDCLEARKKQIRVGQLPSIIDRHSMESSWLDELDGVAVDKNAVVVDSIASQEPTIVAVPGLVEPVTSRLPYRVVTQVRPAHAHGGWLISGNQLVGVKM
ncbi:hypothetical protein FRC12_009767 [Ceratobasidium sp. 428]|nr:hypothetical protein FRC12_009767 [Ceratobasidium sp. 428]